MDTNEGVDLREEILRVREIKDKLSADLDDCKNYLEELEGELIKWFNENNMTSCKDSEGNSFVQVITSRTSIYDFDVLSEYIIENKRTDFLQKRLAQSVIEEALERGENIPGIESVTKLGLRITKNRK